jgi:hypothetical protein
MIVPRLLADATGAISSGLTQACANACNTKNSLPQTFGFIADTLIYLVGAISVIMIIVGGLRYVLSNGDPKATSAAKDTVLYSAIGVVVAIIAYAIVHFVITSITGQKA